jgi:hypothetical protein
VEVDASRNLVREFYLWGDQGECMPVQVEYDWVPSLCNTCKVFGHSSTACPKLSKKDIILSIQFGQSEDPPNLSSGLLTVLKSPATNQGLSPTPEAKAVRSSYRDSLIL